MAKPQKDMKLNEKIQAFEDELKNTKYNKRTQGAVGLLKAKIARLKDEHIRKASKTVKGEGYAVRKSGDASVILVGFPSVGKSTLLNTLTDADSPVAAYEFTTLTVIPGLLEYKSAKIQILDVPGIIHGAASGRGRGKEVLAVAASCDLVVLIVDVFHPEHIEVLRHELYDTNIRLNQHKPVVKIVRKPKGGISLASTVQLNNIDRNTAAAIFREYRIANADVIIRSDITVEQLIDAIEANKRYIPGIVVLNKIDMVDSETLKRIRDEIKPDLCISADRKDNMEELKELIFKKLNFMRVYCKETGKPADMNEPMIIFSGATLKDMCEKLHRDFIKKFKYARVWGKSVKFDGQRILKLEHKLHDEDVVELHVI
ncbi:MAG: GTP-binding protein [Candidatus Woesearchaeota archaeon]